MAAGRIIVVAALALLSAGQAWAASEPIHVDRTFVQAALKRGAILWDVRDQAEYLKGHIPGAGNIGDAGKTLRESNREDFNPTSAIENILCEAGIDPAKEKETVVYRQSGVRAAQTATVLKDLGFEQVKVYESSWLGCALEEELAAVQTRAPAAK